MSLIGAALERADRVREGLRLDARHAALNGRRDVGFMGAVQGSPGMTTSAYGRYSQSSAHHADQYGFYADTPYAIINNIANRLAAQHIRVGKLLKKGSRARSEFAVKSRELLPKFLQEVHDRIEVLPSHRIVDAIDRPNPFMVKYHLLYSTFASLEITGRAYWWMFDDPKEGTQIWCLPTHWCEPVHTQENLFDHYAVTIPGAGKPIPVPRHQIVPFLHPDPSDPFGCLGPLQANARTVMTDFSINLSQRMSFENGINPGLAIMVGKPPEFAGVGGEQMVLTKEQRDQIIAGVRRQWRGVTRFEEPLILDALIKDVKPITTTPKEMAYKESSRLARDKLAHGFSMNPITLGEMEGVNYASSGVADHHVCRSVFKPRVECNSQTLTVYVPPYLARGEEGLVVYQEPVVPSDPEMEMEREFSDFDRGIQSRNDLRRKRGMAPIPGGDFAYIPGSDGSNGSGWVPVGGDPEENPGKPENSGMPTDPDAGGDGNDEGDEDDDGGDHGNRSVYRGTWLKTDDAQGHHHDQNGRFSSGGGGGGSVNDTSDSHDSQAAKLSKKIRKYGKKAVAAAKAVAGKMNALAYHATWAAASSGVAADDVLDTVHDYSKIINAKGIDNWLTQHLGVSGNTAAVVASHVVAYGLVKLKKAIAERRAKEASAYGRKAKPSVKKVARASCDVLHAMLPKMGCPETKLPTVGDLIDYIEKQQKAVEESLKKPGRPHPWGGGYWNPHAWDSLDWRLRPKAAATRKAAENYDAVRIAAENDWKEAILPVFAQLGAKAAHALRTHLAGTTHFSTIESSEVAIDRHRWEQVLTAAIDPILTAAALSGAAAEWAWYKQSTTNDPAKAFGDWFRKLPGSILEAAKKVATDAVERGIVPAIVDGVIDALRKALSRGRKAGLTGEELANKVASDALVGDGAAKRAKEVARNEAAHTVNQGQDAVRQHLEKAGRVGWSEWVTMNDTRVREAHERLHGTKIRPGGEFVMTGIAGTHKCRFPGDPTLPPAYRQWCRCVMVTFYPKR